MSSKDTIEIVNGYRSPEDNEFFFRQHPQSIAGVDDLLEFLKDEGYQIEFIPQWQIKSRTSNASARIESGIRIVKK